MPRLNDIFGGNFLKAEDLQGKSIPVTISAVDVKEFDDGNKLILSFAGKDKKLVCNRTNASIIQEVLGSSDTDDWVGQKVTLITKKVEFQGKLVPAIRVKLEDGVNTATKQEPVLSEDDESNSIPF